MHASLAAVIPAEELSEQGVEFDWRWRGELASCDTNSVSSYLACYVRLRFLEELLMPVQHNLKRQIFPVAEHVEEDSLMRLSLLNILDRFPAGTDTFFQQEIYRGC